MKRVSVFMLLILLLLCHTANANTDYPPYQYMISKGYTLERIDDSPGWRTCNLMGGDGWWSISFSDLEDNWSLLSLPEFNPTFNLDEFEKLFVYLVENFEWDVAFYWPDYDSGSKIAISLNVVKDADNTLENHQSKESFVKALKKRFGISDIVSSSNKPSQSDIEILNQLADMYNDIPDSSFQQNASFSSDARCFKYIIKASDITYTNWRLCDSDVHAEYKCIFDDLVKSVNDTINGIGIKDVSVIIIFTLSEDEIVYFNVNGYDVE